MSPSEFKAWFEGFCEAIDGAPTEDQFKRIKAKVAEVGKPVVRDREVIVEWPTGLHDSDDAQRRKVTGVRYDGTAKP